LNDIGARFKKFRENHRCDIFETAVFGLPVMHRQTKIDGRLGKHVINRRSSPLIIKIIKAANKYYWLSLRLSGEFLPEGGTIYAKNSTLPTKKPDYTLIDKFWNNLKKENGEEFVLSKPAITETVCERIKEQSNPSKIILFGSRARGDANKRSDIDIAVENPKGLLDISGPFDIVNKDKAGEELKKRIDDEGVEL
jgi:CRISPR-associated protein Cmr1